MSNKWMSRKYHQATRQAAENLNPKRSLSPYHKFDNLDGSHPWMQKMPEGFVPYQVRELNSGKVLYFNYDLAKEMGLIAWDHRESLTKGLEKKLLQTFCLQIINEYDLQDPKFPQSLDPSTVKPKPYMATRYLQLQHPDKTGRTSGDGRGLWNGVIEHEGTHWDVSSRGTGVTRLAPGAVEAKKPLKTGVGKYGYGCGLAELDELLAAAIAAEVMHLQGVKTERVLCIIDLGNGHGIGVRAGQNLLRPAHLFCYLKQGRGTELKKALEYYVHRQIQNSKLPKDFRTLNKETYSKLLKKMSEDFANFAALLEVDYIFAWLDWDGDNVLFDAGIIDYGSIRQFGICHDQYRYDDVHRFSTTLTEQKNKARLIVQVFAQMMDYLLNNKKQSLDHFRYHPILKEFDETFEKSRIERRLYRFGFDENQRKILMKEGAALKSFLTEFNYFERAKVSGSPKRVPDGINHPAMYNMRKAMILMTNSLSTEGLRSPLIPEEEFFQGIISRFANSKKMRIRPKHRGHLQNLQRSFRELISIICSKSTDVETIKVLIERSQKLNGEPRLTGNALISIVNSMQEHLKKGMPPEQVQKLIALLIHSQIGMPETEAFWKNRKSVRPLVEPEIYAEFLSLIKDFAEDI